MTIPTGSSVGARAGARRGRRRARAAPRRRTRRRLARARRPGEPAADVRREEGDERDRSGRRDRERREHDREQQQPVPRALASGRRGRPRDVVAQLHREHRAAEDHDRGQRDRERRRRAARRRAQARAYRLPTSHTVACWTSSRLPRVRGSRRPPRHRGDADADQHERAPGGAAARREPARGPRRPRGRRGRPPARAGTVGRPSTMHARSPPTAAPPVTPMMSGATSGLRVIVWNTRPESANAMPDEHRDEQPRQAQLPHDVARRLVAPPERAPRGPAAGSAGSRRCRRPRATRARTASSRQRARRASPTPIRSETAARVVRTTSAPGEHRHARRPGRRAGGRARRGSARRGARSRCPPRAREGRTASRPMMSAPTRSAGPSTRAYGEAPAVVGAGHDRGRRGRPRARRTRSGPRPRLRPSEQHDRDAGERAGRGDALPERGREVVAQGERR